jgi:hypothetical protein
MIRAITIAIVAILPSFIWRKANFELEQKISIINRCKYCER